MGAFLEAEASLPGVDGGTTEDSILPPYVANAGGGIFGVASFDDFHVGIGRGVGCLKCIVFYVGCFRRCVGGHVFATTGKTDAGSFKGVVRSSSVVDFVVGINRFAWHDVEAGLVEEGLFLKFGLLGGLPFGESQVFSNSDLVFEVLFDVVADVFGQAPVGDRLARVEFVDGVGAGRADVFDRSVVVVFVTQDRQNRNRGSIGIDE